MAAFKVPEKGLVVQHDPRTSSSDKHPSQVIQLDVVENLTKDILRSLKNNEPVRLRCGKKPVVQVGKKSIPLESTTATFPSELYAIDSDDNNTLYFSGKLSHTLEVRKAEEDTAGSDEALAALESTLKSIQEQRASNETSIIGSRDGSKGNRDNKVSPLLSQNASLRKDFDHLLARSTPSSPFLSATYSPRLGPTSAPLGAGLSTKDQVRLDAIKIPLIHLLAIRPLTSRGVAEKLRAPRDEVEKILEKVARDTQVGDGRKELKEKSYRELNVHKFNYRTSEDRQSAIANAITAYDRIRVDKKDPLWQLLLPEQERGKGKCLSKLNFDKPAQVPSHGTPRPGDDGGESKVDMSDREHGRAKPKKETASTQKKPKDKSATARGKADVSVPAKSKDIPGKQTRPDGKFKSSERIEDSDEEADAAEAIVAKPKAHSTVTGKAGSASNTKRRPGQEQAKPLTPSHVISPPKKTVHKTSLSSSSSGSGSNNEKPRISSSSDTSKSLKPQSRPDPPTASTSRISPRPRHNSSPQKPSPLGSSPPTTSTDVENSSSSKASNQSSAPSSPPSGTDMPQAKQSNKYSPVISSDKSGSLSRGRSPVRRKVDLADDGRAPKRKAEAASAEDRPSKRQQHEPSPAQKNNKILSNGTTSSISTTLPRAGPVRQNSDSNSSRCSSPEKPGPKREDVIQDARRFQKYYKRYKDLYDRISSVNENERDDKDMGDLWKMHKRLKEMKADIWGNWDKVEKIGKVNDKIDKPMRQAVVAG